MKPFVKTVFELFDQDHSQWYDLYGVMKHLPNMTEMQCFIALRELISNGLIEARKNAPGLPVLYRYYVPILLNSTDLRNILKNAIEDFSSTELSTDDFLDEWMEIIKNEYTNNFEI